MANTFNSNLQSIACGQDTCAVNTNPTPGPKTIGQVMDERIADARKAVEQECINKAKLEALGVLDHHASLYNSVYSHES